MEERSKGQPGGGLVLWLALAIWLVLCLPLALGWQTLLLRDVFATHLHMKAFGAAQLALGQIPATHPGWGLGQVFRGNPNVLAFYPGNLLYLILPFWSAFNLHYVLHWLLAGVFFRILARRLGLSSQGSLVAALTWVGSGWMLSAMTFYNLLTVAAWWPLVLWGGLRGGRRGIALGGLACGMALLGGEPITATLGLIPLLVVTIRRRGWRRGLFDAVAIGLIGLAVALPQLVASLRVVGFSFRGAHGLMPVGAGTYALHPARLLELLVPYPFGFPPDLGRFRFWAAGISPRLPWVLSLHVGIVGLWLAPWGIRRRPIWAGLAALGLLFAWLGGEATGVMETLTAGLFRYPEKFLFWFAIAMPLLVGEGFDRVCEQAGKAARWAFVGGLAFSAAAATLWISTGWLTDQLASAMNESAYPGTVAAQCGLWVVSLVLGSILLFAAAFAAGRRPDLLALLQLTALLPLLALLVADSTSSYREPPEWARLLPRGAGVVTTTFDSPFRGPSTPYRPESSSIPAQLRLAAADLDPSPGSLYGLTYPLAPDLEGMHTPLTNLLLFNLPGFDWPRRLAWLRITGTQAVVLAEDPEVSGLKRLAERRMAGVDVGLYGVEDPAKRAWWPRATRVASSPVEALMEVGSTEDPVAEVTLSEPLVHHPGARIELLEWEPDRIVVEVEGSGGVLVLRRAFHPIWQVSDETGPLRVLTANLYLMAIEVPPGLRRVEARIDSGPETIAILVALVVAALALLAAFVPIPGQVIEREPLL